MLHHCHERVANGVANCAARWFRAGPAMPAAAFVVPPRRRLEIHHLRLRTGERRLGSCQMKWCRVDSLSWPHRDAIIARLYHSGRGRDGAAHPPVPVRSETGAVVFLSPS